MKNLIQEFKAFAIQGNVMDLAIAVVIGTAFGKIVTSLVDHIIMPTIGMIGNFNFSSWTILKQIRIGLFFNNVINFVIIALSVFVAIKVLNKITGRKVISDTPVVK
jgi:large conductance mechanosensitive channel